MWLNLFNTCIKLFIMIIQLSLVKWIHLNKEKMFCINCFYIISISTKYIVNTLIIKMISCLEIVRIDFTFLFHQFNITNCYQCIIRIVKYLIFKWSVDDIKYFWFTKSFWCFFFEKIRQINNIYFWFIVVLFKTLNKKKKKKRLKKNEFYNLIMMIKVN